MAAADGEAFSPRPIGRSAASLHNFGPCRVAFAPRELHTFAAHRRRMTEWHMIGIKHVFNLQLPVAAINVAVHACVKRNFARGGAVDEIVDIGADRRDMLVEAWARWRETRKYKAAILAYARRMRESEFALVEIGAAAFRHRHCQECAVRIVRPAVIEASELLALTAALIQDLGATMRTSV